MAWALYTGKTKKCEKCGTCIGFTTNRNGKVFAVDVVPGKRKGDLVYETGVGAHGNLTPWHSCAKHTENLERREEREKKERINGIAKQYTERMMAAAQAGDLVEFNRLAEEYRQALAAAGLSGE